MSLATTRNNADIIDLLCDTGADPNESCPVQMGYTSRKIYESFFVSEPEPEPSSVMRPQTAVGFRLQTRIVLIDEDNETSLHSTAFHGNRRTIVALLNRGADINARSCFRSTVVLKAMEGDHQHVAILLIKTGAN